MSGAMPDVNTLLALAWPNHQFHHQAHDWFRTDGSADWVTCALTQLGFIRLSSNPAYTPHAKTPLEATLWLDQLTHEPGHRFVGDLPPATSETFVTIARTLQGHKQTTDAYLVALAADRELKLVTFDRRVASASGRLGVVHVLSA